MYPVISAVWASCWTNIAGKMVQDVNEQAWNTLEAHRTQLVWKDIQECLYEKETLDKQ
jgi:hypothetical protein